MQPFNTYVYKMESIKTSQIKSIFLEYQIKLRPGMGFLKNLQRMDSNSYRLPNFIHCFIFQSIDLEFNFQLKINLSS